VEPGVSPPATSILPFGRSVAGEFWPVNMLPVSFQEPVVGLYNSAVAFDVPSALVPPATSTCPFCSSAAP
jgi:hypothetical protein